MMRRPSIVLPLCLLVFTVSVPSADAALILNEALANEPGSATTLEWVEILNWPDTGEAISLSGYKYLDGGQTVILGTEIVTPAGGFAILTRKATGASSFEERWGNASGVWGDHPSETYPILAVTQMSLRNSSDTIRLVSPSGDTSTVLWRSDAGDGISVERIRPGANDSTGNFSDCRDPSGSTPARHNSVIPTRGDLRLDSLRVATLNPEWGQPITLRITITNVGFGTVSGAELSIFQSTGANLDEIGVLEIPDLTEESTIALEHIWSSPPPGVSRLLARIDQDADSTNNSTSETVTVRFTAPVIVISEYLANPEVGGPDEWVEIINLAAFPVSVEGVRIGDSLNTEAIPFQESAISPGEFWILAESETAFRAFYPQFNGKAIHIPGWRALNNSGDGIRLIGPSGEIIDSLTFRTVYAGNRSVERVELTSSFAPPTDWAASIDPAGATPGHSNSVVRGNPGRLTLDSIWFDPPTPSWGDSIRIVAALSNKSFGPASGWSLVASRDLDFSSPGSSLIPIADAQVPKVNEGESVIAELAWMDAAPGIHRIQMVLSDASGEPADSVALVATVRYSQPLIIVSEYMAAPTTSGPGEWVELYNASDIPLSLMGIRIGDSEGLGAIPPPLPEIAPGTFLVLAQSENQFLSYYSGFDGEVRTLSTWQPLNDSGDRIRILGPTDEIIDSVTFGALNRQDRSIERRQLVPAFADPRDWGESIDIWGATPGAANAIRRFSNDISIDSAVLHTETVIWPGPVTGVVYVSNPGFNDAANLFVSVLLPGHGEIIRLTTSSALKSGQRIDLPFEVEAPRIGHNSLVFLLTEDDFGNNNFATAEVTVASPYPAIIISEYLAAPVQPGPGEWVEIYNASNIEVSLFRYSVGDSNAFSFITFALVDYVSPNSFIVLCADRNQFRSWYPSFNGQLLQVSSWRELNNSGDKIRLRGAAGEIVDSLTFIEVHDGNVSSERLSLSPTFSVPSDWTMSVDPFGATPGRPNSVNAASAGSLQVEVTPNPVFRSAGQSARIEYRLEIGESLTLKIYDRAGLIVRTIADDVPSATGFVEWNGTDDDGYELRPGPYVLLASSEPTGSMKKMVVVIAP